VEDKNEETVSTNIDAQKEQRNIKLIAGGAILTLLVVWRVWVTLASVDEPRVEKEDIRIFKNDDMIKTKYIGEIAPELSSQKKEMQMMKKLQKEQQDIINRLLTKEEMQKEEERATGVDFKYSGREQNNLSFPAPFQSADSGNMPLQKPTEKTTRIEPMQESMVFDIKKNDTNDTKDSSKNFPPQKDKKDIILAPGVLIKARLISGVRAPTLTKAVNEPQPVFMKVTDLAILPNHAKANIKDCMIKGEAKGDLSTESVFIRTNFLSCTTNDGEVLVAKLSGSVYGKSGTNGIGGVVVSKQGALLGRSLIAGFVDGFARSAANQYQSVLTSTTGTLTTSEGMSNDEMLKSGAYGGIAQGSKEISKFYMDMVKQIEPSIEIKPNIDVDVMVTDTSVIQFQKNTVGVKK
jgi:conjugal transfer pilus assembly protein TraB